VVSDRFFFITCPVLRRRRTLDDGEFEYLAQVMRKCYRPTSGRAFEEDPQSLEKHATLRYLLRVI